MQIPGAGQWLEEQSALLRAWQEAQRQYRQSQASLYNTYGLDAHGNPDPLNDTGLYQQLNQQEVGSLHQANQAIQNRGFNSNEGFGQSLMQPVRYGVGVQDSRFIQNFLGQQSRLNDHYLQAGEQFQTGMYGALRRAAIQAQRQRRFPTAAPVPWQYGQKGMS